MIALDASAIIALLRNEPGAERVASALPEGLISTVNLLEVLGWQVRQQRDPQLLLAMLLKSPLTISPLSVHEALLAAELVPRTKSRGLSLGDRACLATAITRGIPVLTTDRMWKELDVGVEVVLVR